MDSRDRAIANSTDPRVHAALRDYFCRLDRGESIDVEAFVAHHVAVADELRSFIAFEQQTRRMAGSDSPAVSQPSVDAHTESPRPRAEVSTHSVVGQIEETSEGRPSPKSTVAKSPDDLPENFGRYQVKQKLGKGAMGAVYLAEDTLLHRKVALKTPTFDDDADGDYLRRFHREARAVASLKHPHLCAVYDVGEIGGRHYISMEFVPGKKLQEYIKLDKPMSEKQAMAIVRKVALAMHEAHMHGVIHRDLKPDNIMINEKGEPVVMDFGLVHKLEAKDSTRITQRGSLVGSPAYMSREQVEGDPDKLTGATDQYSLGVILYQLLTSKLPFEGGLHTVLGAILTRNAPPPSQHRADINPHLEVVCLKMMAKDATDRYPSMKAAADALAEVARGTAATSAVMSASAVTAPIESVSSRIADAPTPPVTIELSPSERGVHDAPPARRLATHPGGFLRRPNTVLFGSLVGGLSLLLAVTLWYRSGGVLVKIEVLSDDVEVHFLKETVTIKDGVKTLSVAPGTHRLSIEINGVQVETDTFTLKRGDNPVVTVELVKSEIVAKVGQKELTHHPLKQVDNSPPTLQQAPPPTVFATLQPLPPRRPPAMELESLRLDAIPRELLTTAGFGEGKKAPDRLVGLVGDPQPIQTAFVRALAFSQDGRWLASGSDDQTVVIRDAVTGRAHRVLNGQAGVVIAVAFSADSNTIISAGVDGTLRIWAVDGDASPLILRPELGEIWGMAASGDGRFLAVGGVAGGVKLWKWGDWQTPLTFPENPTKPWSSFKALKDNTSMAFSPNGALLAIRTQVSAEDAPVYLYKTDDGSLEKTLPGHWCGDTRCYHAMTMSFSPDGKYLLSFASGGKGTSIWDVESGEKVAEYPSDQFGAIAISPDQTSVALARNFQTGIEIYDRATQRKERLAGHVHQDCRSVAFHPLGKTLAAGFGDGSVHLWDTATWDEIFLRQGHARGIHSVSFAADGRSLLTAGYDNTVRRWNLARPGENEIVAKIPARLRYAVESPDRKKYVTLVGPVWYEPTDTIVVWDATTNTRLLTVTPAVGLDQIVFSPDGKLLAGSGQATDNSKTSVVDLWNVEQGKLLHTFAKSHYAPYCPPVFSADGALLIAATPTQLQAWDVASGNQVGQWNDEAISVVGISNDRQTLATGHLSGEITIWNAATGTSKKLAGHDAKVTSLKFVPGSKLLVSASEDGSVRIWHPERERALDTVTIGPATGQLTIDVDPSGGYVVVAGRGTVLQILKLADLLN